MIVLIADLISNHEEEGLFSKTFELVEKNYFEEVYSMLKKIEDTVVYNNLNDFIINAYKHVNDIVFSIWSGISSKNRKALVPSICESMNIRYVGADTYTHILCQDKALSKEYCKRFNIKTPNYFLYNGLNNLNCIFDLNLPIVIKPNFEGGSIGISINNLLNNYEEAIDYCKILFPKFGEIIIEEFIGGKEICFILSGNKDIVNLIQGVEIYNPDNSNFFDNHIFGFEVKKKAGLKTQQRGFIPQNSEALFLKLKQIFISLGKVEAIRIDGKYYNNEFYLIELSPDIHFGSAASFAVGYSCQGLSYHEMFKSLIDNATAE